MNKTDFGKHGEDLAANFLQKQGYKVIKRNFRIRGGEIDIIAIDGPTLVHIEVKIRYSNRFGTARETITPWKLKSLLKSAQFYNQKIKWGNRPYRLDLVAIDYTDSDEPRIEIIKNITF